MDTETTTTSGLTVQQAHSISNFLYDAKNALYHLSTAVDPDTFGANECRIHMNEQAPLVRRLNSTGDYYAPLFDAICRDGDLGRATVDLVTAISRFQVIAELQVQQAERKEWQQETESVLIGGELVAELVSAFRGEWDVLDPLDHAKFGMVVEVADNYYNVKIADQEYASSRGFPTLAGAVCYLVALGSKRH